MYLVEMEGFEPSSKREPNRFSTCLVIDLVFDRRQAHDYQPAADLQKFQLLAGANSQPISDFLSTTFSKRLGTGQWGDVSSVPLWHRLSYPTVLQITQRERSCYFRQL